MKVIVLLLCFSGYLYGEQESRFFLAVHQACRTRDEMILVSNKSSDITCYSVFPSTLEECFIQMSRKERELRLALRYPGLDGDLASQMLQRVSSNELWSLNPTRVIALMLLFQKVDQSGTSEAAKVFIAAISELAENATTDAEKAQASRLRHEVYPCIFFADSELAWRDMKLVDYLSELSGEEVSD